MKLLVDGGYLQLHLSGFMNVLGRYIPDSLSYYISMSILIIYAHVCLVVMLNYTIYTIWQNGVVSLDPFCPTEVTAHDREAGLCTVSQFPTQAFRMVSTDEPSQLTISSQDRRALSAEASGSKNDSTICNRKASGSKNDSSIGNRNDSLQDASKKSNNYSKRARISEDEDQRGLLSVVHLSDPVSTKSSSLDNISKDDREVSHVPDVAAVIEDILEQTSKVSTDVSFYCFLSEFRLLVDSFSICFWCQDSRSKFTRDNWTQ